MTNSTRRRAPTPHLRTRPATMITAIGLCLLIILMQLMPQFQNAREPSATTRVANLR